jgi:hypothetical protein
MKTTNITTLAATGVALVALVLGGCGSDGGNGKQTGAGTNLPRGSEPVNLDPADFTTQIDNPYFPIAPGLRWVYREAENGGVQRVEVTVTDATKRIDGVTARIVHDVVTEGGQPIENTYDWYAQDSAGNVWYLGEDTKEYENGKVVSTKGSWEAGVDGAQAGVVMPAKPRVGLSYRQEYYAGQAEDKGRVLSVDEKVEVPFGRFNGAVMTKDFTPLEPDLVEHKLYARGVGPVVTITVSGGSGREELVSFQR